MQGAGRIFRYHLATLNLIHFVARTLHRLTDRKLKSLKRKGQRYDVMDTLIPGFGVRVSEAGRKIFILIARYPGSSNPNGEPSMNTPP